LVTQDDQLLEGADDPAPSQRLRPQPVEGERLGRDAPRNALQLLVVLVEAREQEPDEVVGGGSEGGRWHGKTSGD
jgi:hypothetical protein